jgi:hypothetical protein
VRDLDVPSYRYMCILIQLYMCAQLAEERRRRAVLKSPTNYLSARILQCVPSYYYICALILLYVCPHTAIYVSSYYYLD